MLDRSKVPSLLFAASFAVAVSARSAFTSLPLTAGETTGSNGKTRSSCGFCIHNEVLPLTTTALHSTERNDDSPIGRNSNNDNQNDNDNQNSLNSEWKLSVDPSTARRRARLARENEVKLRFAWGKDLDALRTDIDALKVSADWAKAMGDRARVTDLQNAIAKAQDRDAELVYARAVKGLEEAKKIIKTDKRDEVMKKLAREAALSRDVVPRFNLEGLWVGSYGENGSEIINVTYSGDTLIARKVTGDRNVPRGEVTFEADLSPVDADNSPPLEPLKLTETAASNWGTDQLSRYPGRGQVASDGFETSHFVDGQLILFNGHFSFVWVPTRRHIFFSRPSPVQTLRMLRDVISEEDRIDNMRHHVTRCFGLDIPSVSSLCDETSVATDMSDRFRRIPREIDLAKEMEQIEKASRKQARPVENNFTLWPIKKWRDYLTGASKEEED